jgi:hypothetical protein
MNLVKLSATWLFSLQTSIKFTEKKSFKTTVGDVIVIYDKIIFHLNFRDNNRY